MALLAHSQRYSYHKNKCYPDSSNPPLTLLTTNQLISNSSDIDYIYYYSKQKLRDFYASC